MHFIKVDAYVSHNSLGVCKIKKIEKRRVGSVSQDFIVMTSAANQCTAIVPVQGAVNFIRPLSTIAEIEAQFDTVRGPVKIDVTTWNQRYRSYMEKIKFGRFCDWLTVAVNLLSLQKEKDLSFGERKMIDQCVGLMAGEIHVQNRMSLQGAENYVRQTLLERVR